MGLKILVIKTSLFVGLAFFIASIGRNEFSYDFFFGTILILFVGMAIGRTFDEMNKEEKDKNKN